MFPACQQAGLLVLPNGNGQNEMTKELSRCLNYFACPELACGELVETVEGSFLGLAYSEGPLLRVKLRRSNARGMPARR